MNALRRFFVISSLSAVAGCGGGGGTSAPTYTVGGTIAGLTAPGLVLANGNDTVAPAANASSFTFAIKLKSSVSYAVSIRSQPSAQTCAVTNGSGTVGSSNITSISVACPSPWIWMNGSSTTEAPGIYGTQDIAAAGNVPGARYGGASWTDAAGDFWLFGGLDSATLTFRLFQ
jgi:hypothetical protein